MSADREFMGEEDIDPFWRTIELGELAEVSPFGIPVQLRSNSIEVTESVRETYGQFDGTADFPPAEPPIRIRIAVVADRSAPVDVDRVEWQFPTADTALMRSNGLIGTLDLAARTAVAYIERSFLAQQAQLRHTVLEGMILTLVGRYDRHPVHGAALRAGDAAVLLHGPSGVGKSTLSYLAHRNGIDVLADDVIRVQLEPELRIWGMSGRVHLPADSRRRFSELAGTSEMVRSSAGSAKLAVDLAPPPAGLPPYVRRVKVCLVERGDTLRLTPATPAEIERAILESREAKSDLNPVRRTRVAALLADGGGWRLQLGGRLRPVLGRLREMLAWSA